MLRLSLVLISLSIIQTIYTQEPPPLKCRGPPPGVTNPRECCKVPHLFAEEDLSACGIEKPEDGQPPIKPGPPDCSKQICVMKKHNLIKDETKLDVDAAKAFVDKWADANPEFKDAVKVAKERCLKNDLPGPPHICEPDRVMFCLMHTMYDNCPNWQDSENCKKLKDHIEECKAYIPH